MSFSALQRETYFKDLKELDLLVIGGGITGSGIALDASLRGLKVGLVEMQDFAAGTSSRSTKLIHGGLRYLKQFDVKLVAEVGKEREIVYENAPHVTVPERMMLPLYKRGTFGRFSTSIGLMLYDFLAGVRKSERRAMLNKEETLKLEPLLREEGLIGSGVYVEYKTDDSRLTIEVLKKAVEKGAVAVNYARVGEFIYKNNKVVGVKVKDTIHDNDYSLYAKKIVSATGAWVDELRELDRSKKGKHLMHTKGVHLIFDKSRFPLKQAVYFDTHDGRMVFAIPRAGKTYLGTTDTVYKGDLANPRVSKEDKEYLLKAVNHQFPTLKLTEYDVDSSYSGIRALIHEEGKSPSEISRKDEIFISKSGLISIAGGKLTGYRKMAEKVVDTVIKILKEEEHLFFKKVSTKKVPLSGGIHGGSEGFQAYLIEKINDGIRIGLTESEAKELITRYGTNAEYLFKIIETDIKNISSNMSKITYATLKYGIEEEMVVTPLDYYLRRTGALLFDKRFYTQSKEHVIQLMADSFNWSALELKKHTEDLEKEMIHTTLSVQ